MKKILSLLLVGVMTCSVLAGCGNNAGGTSQSEAPKTESSSDGAPTGTGSVAVTFCNMLANDHPQSLAALNVLAPEISKATNGDFTIDVQVNGALGSDSEATEATIMGTMKMCGPSCATLASFDPNWYILDVPYVFNSAEHARAALDGELGEYLSNSLEETCGLICLGFGESGMRNLSNNTKEITSPADMKGMKIRVLENKYHLAAFTALGANPTPMAFAEVFTALQTNQIDGQDNPITITCTSKFYEVQKYYALTQHMFCGNCIVVNAEWFRSLPENYQEALRAAAKNMITEQRKLIDENEAAYVKEMESAGVTVTTLSDDQKRGFIDATQSVRDDFAKEFGEAGKTMLELADKYK